MYDLYKEISKLIEQSPKNKESYFNIQRYLGTTSPYLGISTTDKKTLAITFYKTYPDIAFEELSELLDRLNKGSTFEEKSIGPALLGLYKQHYEKWKPSHLHNWLIHLTGWCEIDTLCQSTFSPEFFLNRWPLWENALSTFAQDNHISVRRASLVLLCRSVRKSEDIRCSTLAFENISKLQSERDILITKAVSWLLRDLVKYHSTEVKIFLAQNEKTLPKIALRETRNKLTKGRKN